MHQKTGLTLLPCLLFASLSYGGTDPSANPRLSFEAQCETNRTVFTLPPDSQEIKDCVRQEKIQPVCKRNFDTFIRENSVTLSNWIKDNGNPQLTVTFHYAKAIDPINFGNGQTFHDSSDPCFIDIYEGTDLSKSYHAQFGASGLVSGEALLGKVNRMDGKNRENYEFLSTPGNAFSNPTAAVPPYPNDQVSQGK